MKTKFLFVLFLIFVFVGFALCHFLFSPSHPSDNSMETFFLNNEKDFEKLRLMFDADKNCSLIGYNENLPVIDYSKKEPRAICQISEERQNEYRNLFWNLKIKSPISRNFDKITFTKSFITRKRYFNGETAVDEKGYIYSPTELSPLTDSLDNSERTQYKKIKRNWYLYFETSLLKPE